ncbi:hypothetical protein K435DRAFT_707727 [Dendrothele bispora CBS 962.96]|uniref:RRM domain-containing protein n=1 Tax=Dendrothele bispora (strain CBS 962.96) TaxID=1314807 RepID=A0A4S8MXL9_DENBC|nr:hypothetical protein K435DRAFT_707727 [Dendrothele bispora CBS 962.96]
MSSSSSSSSSVSPEPPANRKRTAAAAEIDEDSSDETSLESEHELDQDSEADDDAPPLSHAEKRRQKKKEKLEAEAQKDGPPKKKRKLADGKARVSDSTAEDKRRAARQNSVWVGNLSFKTTPEALRGFFEGVGEITRINMPTKPAGKPGVKGENRGFAYVDFSTPDAKIVAITLSERPLNGRKLLIKDGDSFEGRPKPAVPIEETSGDQKYGTSKSLSKTAQKILSQQKKPPAPTLFLGNLPFETTEDSLREMLDAHRRKTKEVNKDDDLQEGVKEKEDWIRRIRLGTFEDTGVCKGFAFVDFSSIDNATSALVNPKNHNFNGRRLVVEYASAEAVRRGPNKPKGEGKGDIKITKHDKVKEGHDGKNKRHRFDREENAGAEVGNGREENNEEDSARRARREFRQGTKGPRSRPKPGAALAQAVRQSAAIVTNNNAASKKIVFE